MKILAIDTSTEFLSVACLEDRKTVCCEHERVGIKHSEILVSRIRDMLKQAQWDIVNVDLIAFGSGPGSFTGLRIGASTVKGFALVSGTKLVGVPTLDAIAERGPAGKGLVIPVLDAHKGKVYSCVYEKNVSGELERKTDYLLCDVEKLRTYVTGKAVFFGSGLDKYGKELEKWPMAEIEGALDWYPRAEDIGRMGLELSQVGTVSPDNLEPMYLYPKECNVLKKQPGKNNPATNTKK